MYVCVCVFSILLSSFLGKGIGCNYGINMFILWYGANNNNLECFVLYGIYHIKQMYYMDSIEHFCTEYMKY